MGGSAWQKLSGRLRFAGLWPRELESDPCHVFRVVFAEGEVAYWGIALPRKSSTAHLPVMCYQLCSLFVWENHPRSIRADLCVCVHF